MRDQAERLRLIAESYRAEISAPRPSLSRRARVIAVTSGKGGVGKTNLSVNLSYALISLGREVMLLDADLGLANVDVLLGSPSRFHLGHVTSGKSDILDVIYRTPDGLQVIAGGSGVEELADMPEVDLHRFIQSMRKLESQSDYLIIDTGAGMGRTVTNFVLSADLVLVVATPEPTAITDAYALIKAVVRRNPAADLKLVINQAESMAEADEAANRLTSTVLRFLDSSVEYLGAVPNDREVPRAVRNQQPFFRVAPQSAASQAVLALARRLNGDPETPVRGVGLFFDRLTKVVAKWR